MSFEIKGIIELIKPLEELGEKKTPKIEILVKTEGEYGQTIPISFFGDKVSYLDSFSAGDDVTVSVNLKGSQYQERNYVSLNSWRITKTPLNG